MKIRIILILMLLVITTLRAKEDNVNWKKLTPAEKQVIENKGTEAPYSGKYLDNHQQGIYTCKRCGSALYRSQDKFNSGCGWPSFDDEIEGAVTRKPDSDGRRTEIVCSNCGAHLGHVFEGEQFTPKDTRHCVNSISMDFIPEEIAYAYIAGGCFWGVEYYMEKMEGVIKAESGYMGGSLEDPEYYDVTSGTTGHAETVRVAYNPQIIDYKAILKKFFEIHDPTQLNHQGPDYGEQYRSAIFYENDAEKAVAKELIDYLKSKDYEVVTQLKEADKFWLAEDYHQDYYNKRGGTPYCHRPVKRFD